ncbi:hypothetical protein I8G32_01634 [Rhodopseudomonas palustris]|uniref:Toll/interleukin-1 receptor domain-containing protein n=1 Tax=Rhodopseudomonas palustris (strain ATCC BAA-98 / CGA009) TaxID=258594 RepID=Q6N9F4_RHOPA|nr:toll/interleukin-1 receptor domain-containing protein [Rhodopseudomonas palustris]ACF00311.1 TIR protein [Rhodopseudomonas palustris TIE-1]OPF91185.1 TIR domain-containing protein [Rhodopseudomonas palustris]QQM03097.1 hypothetical protein I8G32_01634 [Rhodopseudomonas palustris]RJF60657.1 TIR domain-containing protein [Rhodopseudomonas palustris]WAB79264.1 toll/interleukin-1 receptor domain-containing protein [Rhodopseudomonas palustris]
MPKVFFSYSHADEALRDQIETQLALLKRQGIIDVWHDRRIGAGREFAREIDQHVESDEIILLLVSADFLASDYCYEKEMLRALTRHDAGEAVVIPVILRACDWHGAPFGKLNAVPRDGKPITQFADRDAAMLEVARAVRSVAERFGSVASPKKTAQDVARSSLQGALSPRSSNLRLAKTFNDKDKDEFRTEGFEYLSRFFENSIAELSKRNPGIEATFRKIDANRFVAKAYRNGRSATSCTVFMGGMMGNGISYLARETTESNSHNEMLTVEADDQALYFQSFGMAVGRGNRQKLSYEGAAELYWTMFIEPLQQGK